jgi:Spy/CpxP family protein refolding chaperone
VAIFGWAILVAAALAVSVFPLSAAGQVGSAEPAEYMDVQNGTHPSGAQYSIGHIEARVK